MKLIQERNKSVTYKEARVYLDELSKYGSVLGLDAIRGLLRELGNPQDDLRFIHIAGTNGKGSVLAYTSTILSEAGYRIGRYVSPTVVSYRERIQVDGEMISKHAFAEETEKVQDAIVRLKEAGKQLPTVFEAETAIAFLYYKRMKCDFVVLESGLGGMEDATNVVKNTVCVVFSPISMDHIGVIGNTLSEIAENKAGIIKPGCIVVSAPQKQEVREILEQKARQFGCPIIYAAIREKEEFYNKASATYAEISGKRDTAEKDLYQANKDIMRVTQQINACLDENKEDEAMQYAMKKSTLENKINVLKETIEEMKEAQAHQKDIRDQAAEELQKLKEEKEQVLFQMEADSQIIELHQSMDSLNTNNESDRMLERVREGARKTRERAEGSRIAYDSSAQANERRLANSERERNARQILDDMKRQRGNK